jgi:molybdopterin synthase catalytic subunit
MLKDLVGRATEQCDFPPGANLRSVFDTYAGRYPRLKDMASSIVLARNQEFAELSACLEDGDEIAFLPPVSGGSGAYPIAIAEGGHYFALTRESIDTRAIIGRLMNGSEGAVVTFEGTVRNNTRGRPTLCLDYEGYESMAIRMMAQIGQEIAASHQISRIAIVHRLGRMLVGETSVAVIVTAPHRGPAFEAAREGIDRLKKTVPIWKKEHFLDGEVWVEGEWGDHVPVGV